LVSRKKDITFLAIIEKTFSFYSKTDRDLTMLRNKMHTGLTRSLALSYRNLPKQLALYSLFSLYGTHYVLYRNVFKRGKSPASLGVDFLQDKKRKQDLCLSAALRRRAIDSIKSGKQPIDSILDKAVETVKAHRDLLISLFYWSSALCYRSPLHRFTAPRSGGLCPSGWVCEANPSEAEPATLARGLA
jgi:hypothetical protein